LSRLRRIEDSVDNVNIGIFESGVFLDGGLSDSMAGFSEFGFGFEVVNEVIFFISRGS